MEAILLIGGEPMLLDKKVFFVREEVEFLKLAGTYHILDPVTNRTLGVAKEEPGGWIKFFRLFISKLFLPTRVKVYDHTGQSVVFSMKKPFSFIRSKVFVWNGKGREIGCFHSKIMTVGGGFWVYDQQGRQVAEIKGDWKGWNFKLIDINGRVAGTITKKWAGIGKELFTSADSYVIELSEDDGLDPDRTALLLAAGLAIDIVFKENKR
jgi:uncharacterized protein YxjI